MQNMKRTLTITMMIAALAECAPIASTAQPSTVLMNGYMFPPALPMGARTLGGVRDLEKQYSGNVQILREKY